MTAHTGAAKGSAAPALPLHTPERFTHEGFRHVLHQWIGKGWNCTCGEFVSRGNYADEDAERLAMTNHRLSVKAGVASAPPRSTIGDLVSPEQWQALREAVEA